MPTRISIQSNAEQSDISSETLDVPGPLASLDETNYGLTALRYPDGLGSCFAFSSSVSGNTVISFTSSVVDPISNSVIHSLHFVFEI